MQSILLFKEKFTFSKVGAAPAVAGAWGPLLWRRLAGATATVPLQRCCKSRPRKASWHPQPLHWSFVTAFLQVQNSRGPHAPALTSAGCPASTVLEPHSRSCPLGRRSAPIPHLGWPRNCAGHMRPLLRNPHSWGGVEWCGAVFATWPLRCRRRFLHTSWENEIIARNRF